MNKKTPLFDGVFYFDGAAVIQKIKRARPDFLQT